MKWISIKDGFPSYRDQLILIWHPECIFSPADKGLDMISYSGDCFKYYDKNILDDRCEVKYWMSIDQPERSKREDSQSCEMRCSEHCGNTVRDK